MSRRPNPTKQKPTKEYCLSLAGDVATKGIRIALGYTKDMSMSLTNMFEISLYAENDGRIKNKVYTMLKELGVLDTFSYTQHDNFYRYSSRKKPKFYFGAINEEWFNKNAPTMAKAPVFQTLGKTTTKKNSWSIDEKIVLLKEKDNYRNLFSGSLTDAEMIYIYYHMNEYDIQKKEEINNSNRFGSSTHTVYLFYPKALLSTLSKDVFYSHAMDYLEKHLEWVMINTLEIKNDKIINKVSFSNISLPTYTLNENSKQNTEFIDKQLLRLDKCRTMLNIGEHSLLRLKETVNKFGGWDKVKDISKKAFIKYLEESFPLHINDEEKNKDLKELCLAVQEGKNKGFSERLQELNLKEG